jgi:ABC-type multidrug transport system fused ATPase/permease subunit
LSLQDVAYLHPDVEVGGLLAPVRDAEPRDGARGVRGVTFDVPAGGVTALVGPTGSGKSTVAWLLARLVAPDAGRVAMDGVDLRELRRGELARHVAVAFQEAFLFDGTVRDNLTLGEDIDTEELVGAARIARADGFIQRLPLGYDTPVGERGTTLSGGERQRIALARAILRRPRLLVLDDATSAVDPAVEAQILEGLTRIDASVVIVASRGGSVALADRVVVLDDGVVIDEGLHEEVLARTSRYAAIVRAYDDGVARAPDADDHADAGSTPDGRLR